MKWCSLVGLPKCFHLAGPRGSTQRGWSRLKRPLNLFSFKLKIGVWWPMKMRFLCLPVCLMHFKSVQGGRDV